MSAFFGWAVYLGIPIVLSIGLWLFLKMGDE